VLSSTIDVDGVLLANANSIFVVTVVIDQNNPGTAVISVAGAGYASIVGSYLASSVTFPYIELPCPVSTAYDNLIASITKVLKNKYANNSVDRSILCFVLEVTNEVAILADKIGCIGSNEQVLSTIADHIDLLADYASSIVPLGKSNVNNINVINKAKFVLSQIKNLVECNKVCCPLNSPSCLVRCKNTKTDRTSELEKTITTLFKSVEQNQEQLKSIVQYINKKKRK
jgi:hypothetical protein